MPKLNEMIESKFLKKEDVGVDGTVCTIKDVTQEKVGREDDPNADTKWCLVVKEFKKPMVLNKTNMQRLAKITGSEDTDDWIGQRVILYNDEDVEFRGEIVGAIRVRALRKAKPAVAASKNFEVEAMRQPGEDDGDEPVLDGEV